MMKLILVMALVALAFPREGECLKCYNCKSGNDPPSSIMQFNHLQLCSDEMEQSPTETYTGPYFAECTKILEKVKVGDKEKTLIIRTLMKTTDNINLDSTNFSVTKCKEDLCNSASVIRDVAFGVVITVAMAVVLWA